LRIALVVADHLLEIRSDKEDVSDFRHGGGADD